MKNDKDAYCTTVFDYYGLPRTFPGTDALHAIQGNLTRVEYLEHAMGEDINHRRFVPNLILHEFEALLFSDIRELDTSDLYRTKTKLHQLEKIMAECGSPEEINDNYETAPSRRIKKLYPSYDKVLHGVDVAGRIGIPLMREMCPHFDAWVERLERLEPL